jgi:hypothetical protein
MSIPESADVSTRSGRRSFGFEPIFLDVRRKREQRTRCRAGFRTVASLLPTSGPDAVNTQSHSEQP